MVKQFQKISIVSNTNVTDIKSAYWNNYVHRVFNKYGTSEFAAGAMHDNKRKFKIAIVWEVIY